ncbi:MAG: hypothetical protein MUE85_03755 [Microscillaceae bacterium]|jgi:uncharacterized protein (TIGR02646 family)|nr:hypothetical protein [Microscillaceae bacterium]
MINIIRSQHPIGEVDYQNEDIRELVKNDFFKMCYLCEEVTRHFEIDHFYPQNYYPDEVNNWDNLFYICQKCNKIKPKNINTHSQNEILNNCVDDVESLIILRYDQARNHIEITSDNQDRRIEAKVKQTIRLLNKIYNEQNTNSKSYKDLQDEIKKEIAYFFDLLDNYEKSEMKFIYKNQIKKRLSKKNLDEKKLIHFLQTAYHFR